MSLDPKPPVLPFGFVHIPDEHRAWLGSAEELAELANRVQRETGADSEINERLVRYYVTMGVLDRPRRLGKEARYSFRHLSQLIVLRRMLDQGLSLGNVRQLFTSIPWDQIDNYRQGQTPAVEEETSTPATAAQLLVESFKTQARLPRVPEPQPVGTGSPLAPGPRANAGGARRVLIFPVVPGCEIVLEEDVALRLSQEALHDLTDNIKTALHSSLEKSR
jgi:DNA-binding transcriptional MerR regulator